MMVATASGFIRAEVINGTCNPFYSDTLEIQVLSVPVVDAGTDLTACMNSSMPLGGSPTASGGAGGYTYSWSPAAGLDSANIANPSLTVGNTGIYTILVMDSNGCSATDTVFVNALALPMAFTNGDTVLNCGDSLPLFGAVNGTGPFTYSWTPAANIANPSAMMTSMLVNSNVNVVFAVTDVNGCVGTDTMMVTASGYTTGSDTLQYTGVIDTSWVVPTCVDSITIEVWGAKGGFNASSVVQPGLGAYQKGTFAISSGTRLKILVGYDPSSAAGSNGGGGGTFVTLMNNTPLIIAGGGGGSSGGTDSPDKHGQAGQAGGTGAAGGGTGGTNGSGGNIGSSGFQAGAGGGLLTNGADGWTAGSGGQAFVNGGAGANVGFGIGGFGGGGNGSGYVVGGGGGGYSGGGSGGNSSSGVGGGGGSYNGGNNTISLSGVNNGNGKVVISW
jgi:hypothetical protein